jgi:hypothetical protein
MRTSQPLTEAYLFERLEALERAVNVPIVSGEVGNWLSSVLSAARDVEETTCGYYSSVHPDLFRQIVENDPGQNSRVQTLEQEDEEICNGLHEVVEFARKLDVAGDAVEPDERLIANATNELSERLISAILRVRKHETQISTWHVEAMLRDRGDVD